MPLHEQAPGARDGCGCARPAVKRARIVRPSSLIEPGDRLVMPLRRTVVEPTPQAFGAAIFVRYASNFCLLAAAARNGESVPKRDMTGGMATAMFAGCSFYSFMARCFQYSCSARPRRSSAASATPTGSQGKRWLRSRAFATSRAGTKSVRFRERRVSCWTVRRTTQKQMPSASSATLISRPHRKGYGESRRNLVIV
jgi:hypothetical protein